MTQPKVLASGTPGTPAVASGVVLEWEDAFLDHPEPLMGAVIYDRRQTSLFKTAFVIEHGASAILMSEGGKNYHPLILASEAGIPSIAGLGKPDNLVGRLVTVDGGTGQVFAGSASSISQTSTEPAIDIPANTPPVYVNVGYPSGLKKAADSQATGLGLLRTEFAAVKTLALNLNEKLDNGPTWRDLLEQEGGNEADAIYTIAKDARTCCLLQEGFRQVIKEAVDRFGSREVIVRTLDIARRLDEPMGNRGIRRCVGSGGQTIRHLCRAIREILDHQDSQIGLILPLVSHYGQIQTTMDILLSTGLNLRQSGSDAPHQISFGWEIEQPAASANNGLWLAAFAAEFGQPPHMIGIGTNDLTQFTIALGRDAHAEEQSFQMAEYLRELYDEHEFSVVRQIIESTIECHQAGTRVFLLGQAGADPLLAPLLFAYKIIPSVATARVRDMLSLGLQSLQRDAPNIAVKAYKDWVLARYPGKISTVVEQELDSFFATHPPPES